VVVQQVPQQRDIPVDMAYKAIFGQLNEAEAHAYFRDTAVSEGDNDHLQKSAADIIRALDGVTVVETSAPFLRDGRYQWFLDGALAYTDDDHLSTYGAFLLQDIFADALRSVSEISQTSGGN